MDRVRVVVDRGRCDSHGCCAASAPEIFELGDDDQLRILIESPPPELRPKLDAAILGCPKQALSLDG